MQATGFTNPRVDASLGKDRNLSQSQQSPDRVVDSTTIFLKKLSYCSQPVSQHCHLEVDKRDRRRIVQEVVALLSNAAKTEQLVNPHLPAIMAVIEASLFRPLKKLSLLKAGNETLDKAEQEQFDDPSWPVIEPVYALFEKLLESEHINQKTLKNMITPQFLQNLIGTFDTQYPPEREALKSCLHLLYLKQSGLRKTIRKLIAELFHRMIHEDFPFNGVSEILEIKSTIISGFTSPIKEEHLQFFEHALLPLHKIETEPLFHQDLMRCTIMFVQKDHSLGVKVIEYLDKIWPKTNSSKQLAFMEELVMVVCTVDLRVLKSHVGLLFKRVSSMILSPHFKVCDFALSCFEKKDCMALVEDYRDQVFPIVVPSLKKACQDQWQPTLVTSLRGLLGMLEDLDSALYRRSLGIAAIQTDEGFGTDEQRQSREKLWTHLTKLAVRNGPTARFSNEPYRSDRLVGDLDRVW
jgi:serine/threonine-protein phosphatase 2A regulatory subunit B'